MHGRATPGRFHVIAIAAVLATALIVAAQAPAPVQLEVPGRASAHVWLAAEGARVAAAWGAREPGGATDVYLAVSADSGRTFSAPVRVNDAPGTARLNGEMAPRPVFVRGKGDPFAVEVLWTAREGRQTAIRSARSLDGGRTFAASRELQGSAAAGDRGWPALASDARGGVHAIWLDHRGMAATAGAGHHQHGAMSAEQSALYYSNGTAARALTTSVCYCCKTALAAAPDGALVAAWRHVYPGNIRDIAFTSSRDGGRTFAAPVRVSEDEWELDGCPDDGPALAVDAGSTVHLVWPTVTSQPRPHKALFYATSGDGRTFSARTRVSPVERNVFHPQIAVGPGGEVIVLWDEITGGRRRVFVSRKDLAGGFGAAQSLSEGTAASYAVPVFSGGAFVVAWTEGAGDDSRIAVRRLPVR